VQTSLTWLARSGARSPHSPASQPGLVRRFDSQGNPPTIVADTLARPTAMTLDEKTDTLYVTEYLTGRIVAISLAE